MKTGKKYKAIKKKKLKACILLIQPGITKQMQSGNFETKNFLH